MNAPLPEWLAPSAPPETGTYGADKPKHSPVVRQVRQQQLDNLFHSSLLQLEQGIALPVILRNDPRGISSGELLRYIFRDPQRRTLYYDALQIGAEIVFSEVLDIADATANPMEDVQRSKLRIDTRKWWMSVANRQRFGDIKKLDVTTQTITEDSLRSLSIDDLKRMVVSGQYPESGILRDDEIIVEPAPMDDQLDSQ